MSSYTDGRPVFLLSFREPPEEGLIEQLGLRHEYSYGDCQVFSAAAPPARVVARLHDLLPARACLSAAFLSELPPEDRRWLALEWHGRFVAHEALVSQLDADPNDWETDVFSPQAVVIFHPAAEPAPENDDGGIVTVPDGMAEGVLAQRFPDLLDPEVGGARATLSLCPRVARSVIIGSLADVGLERVPEQDSLPVLRSLGSVEVEAVGMTRSAARDRLREIATLGESTRTLEVTASEAGYAAVVTIRAPVDPRVRIPIGLVFEQVVDTGKQNLSVAAAPEPVVIEAGEVIAMALPAWCLNEDLGPPGGDPVRVTPLRFTAPDSSSQTAVWAHVSILKERLRRLGGGGLT